MSGDDAVVRGTVVAKIHRMLDTIEARDAEIERLRAEVERKHDYACRMDALAEERLWQATRLRAEVERLRAENAALRQNEWRLIWGLCTNCGRNRDQEASRA